MINRSRIGAGRSLADSACLAVWSRCQARPAPGSGSASAFRSSSVRRPTITARLLLPAAGLLSAAGLLRRAAGRPMAMPPPPDIRGQARSRPVLRDRRRGLPDGASGRVRLVLLLHHGAGPGLGPRNLMASPPGSGPPEQAQDNPREPPPAAAPQYAARIEDYAMIGDCHSAALVSRDGSIDWLCWPRFDSPACFAALVGTPDNGRWRIAPAEPPVRIRRQYRPGTMILETIFETKDGSVALIDFMTAATGSSSVVRIVEGRGGQVADAARSRAAVRLRLRGAVGDATAAQHGTARDRRARCRGAAQRCAAARREAHHRRRVHRRGRAARSVHPVAWPSHLADPVAPDADDRAG